MGSDPFQLRQTASCLNDISDFVLSLMIEFEKPISSAENSRKPCSVWTGLDNLSYGKK